MKCECPEGFPQSEERGFGDYADEQADIAGVLRPRFGVTIHTGVCSLPDAPHTIPQDYAHPQDNFDFENPKVSRPR